MLTLVILAAGAGRRYGGLKQLAPIGPGGETLLEYSAYDARGAGFSRVVLVVRPEDERTFRRRLAPMAKRLAVAFVHQTTSDLASDSACRPDRTRPWGTGHAVLAAEAEVAGAFAVVNADDFYGAGSFAALAAFLRRSAPATLAVVGFEVAQTLSDAGPVSRALCRSDEDGLLGEIVELEVWRQDGRIVHRVAGDRPLSGRIPPLEGGELVSMNAWGLSHDLFAELRRRFAAFLAASGKLDDAEFLLPDVARALIRDRRFRIEVLRGSGPWCGITFRQDEERAASVIASLVERGQYPQELWA